MSGLIVQMYARRIAGLIDAINTEYGTSYDVAGAFVQTTEGPRWIEWTDLSVHSLSVLLDPTTDIGRYLIHRTNQDEGKPPRIFVDKAILEQFQLSREGVERVSGEGSIPAGIRLPGKSGPKSRGSRERI